MMEIQNSISLVNIIPQTFCKCITFQDLHMVMNQKLYWIMKKEKKSNKYGVSLWIISICGYRIGIIEKNPVFRNSIWQVKEKHISAMVMREVDWSLKGPCTCRKNARVFWWNKCAQKLLMHPYWRQKSAFQFYEVIWKPKLKSF